MPLQDTSKGHEQASQGAASSGPAPPAPAAATLAGDRGPAAPPPGTVQRPGRRPRTLALAAARALAARLPWIAAGLAAAIPVISSTVKAVHAGWVAGGR